MARMAQKPQPTTAKFFPQRLIKTSPNPRFYRGMGTLILRYISYIGKHVTDQ